MATTTPPDYADLAHQFRQLACAYPIDLFPALTTNDRLYNPEVITRASAQMGRHFSGVFQQAANAMDGLALLRERIARAETRADELHLVILWALGQHGDFPDWPATVKITGNPKYWWRTELQQRLEAAMAAPPRP